jgi:CDP-diacylglycerol pyrophosphatase
VNSTHRRAICAVIVATAFSVGSVPVAVAANRPGSPPDKADSHSSTYSPEINSGRDSLRQIVQDRCMVHWAEKQDPAPCERISLPNRDGHSGYALLADRKGGAHYLLIPTQTMTGMESSELLDPDTPNYFAQAWTARDLITRYVGHPVARTSVGLAVNTANARGQDQFHIHIECVRQDVFESLRASAEQIGDTWAPLAVTGATYQAMRVMGIGLDGSNPFELLSKLKPGIRNQMGNYTLFVAGMQFQGGAGFVLLTGTGPTGELLLDSTCAVAGAGG